ncbi:ArsR family transcriptional regulator [Neolewinella xylanilytica]|uniref:ArsR family transcriptional regulator n=1 Tax=Neolewinella xylanilytica TaxID=1514080 RepID=A0A2S6I714_9BACT|nr:metalloregulator ArsR/SmtB family transcription factor [Neolewinella xylanilytica]PPK87249.1 ArsR family transcriptional regulator [Neolewinella xylanilytica]
MGAIKTANFTDAQNAIAVYARAFGHPARVAILQYLFRMDSCVCGEIVAEIDLAQPTISQHLKELRQLGLIRGTVDGTRVCYCIDTDNWARMKETLHDFLDQDLPKLDCC